MHVINERSPPFQTESLEAMAVGLSELRSLDICGCEQLHEDAVVALSSLRNLTELNVGSCHQAITVRWGRRVEWDHSRSLGLRV